RNLAAAMGRKQRAATWLRPGGRLGSFLSPFCQRAGHGAWGIHKNAVRNREFGILAFPSPSSRPPADRPCIKSCVPARPRITWASFGYNVEECQQAPTKDTASPPDAPITLQAGHRRPHMAEQINGPRHLRQLGKSGRAIRVANLT